MTETPTLSYFQTRCAAIGINTENNFFSIKEFPAIKDSKLINYPLLAEDQKTGGIFVPVYGLDGHPVYYDANKHTNTKTLNPKAKAFEILRYHPDIYNKLKEEAEKQGADQPGKYKIPKGAKSVPWIAPNIITAFAAKEKINTIVLTEGYIKAISGYVNGLFIFGLSSISTYKDKDTGTLHPDILQVIEVCEVENIVLLYDGDCRNISLKALEAGKDLYRRPNAFFSSARNISELLKDYRKERHFDVYFSHVASGDIEGEPKGLDDLFEISPGKGPEIVAELTSFSKRRGFYFRRINITAGLYKVLEYLAINSAETFYTAHGAIIGEKPFIFHGTKYQYDTEKKEIKVLIPGAAKSYFRCGDDYYEKIFVPNEIGNLEYRFVRRSKSTIVDDHGKKIIEYIPKYKAFCVKPDHINYQEIIDNCFNSYKPFEYKAANEKECPVTLQFLNHIFGVQLDLGLDYIQLLYQKPTEKLPILCLVSKEQKTGKTTFTDFLKAIFTGNMAIIGNDQLENKFNASWADKLIIACEESFIDKKKTVEKIKALSTGKRIEMERKGVDSDESSFFGKFILNSNNETGFTIANETDERYWVIKVPVVQIRNPNLLEELIEEIPNFLCYLNSRSLVVSKKEDRMWFEFAKIKTDAYVRLVEANRSGPQRELTHIIKNLFIDCGWWHLQLTLKYICETLFKNKYAKEYIEKMIREKFNVRTGSSVRCTVPEIKMIYREGVPLEEIVTVSLHGKSYSFFADQFLSADEINEFQLSPAARSLGQEDFCPYEIRTRKSLNEIQLKIPEPEDLPF